MRLAVMLLALLASLAASPAVAASPWIILFEPNSTRLDGRNSDVLGNVVETARTLKVPKLVIEAHADRRGSSDQNLILSRRRAEAVRRELLRRGLTSTDLEIRFHGESRPLVATADGVAEAQNRRVEIVIACAQDPRTNMCLSPATAAR